MNLKRSYNQRSAQLITFLRVVSFDRQMIAYSKSEVDLIKKLISCADLWL